MEPLYAISRHANLTLPIRDRKVHYNPNNGAVEKVDPAVVVQFQHSGTVPDYARDAVTKLSDWGTGVGLDEDPFERCGSFDLEHEAGRNNWDDDTIALIREVLTDGSGSLYVLANPPRASKPWPNYSTIDGPDAAKQIAFQVDLLGLNASDVAQYERENAKREDVLSALEALVPADEDVVGVIQA